MPSCHLDVGSGCGASLSSRGERREVRRVQDRRSEQSNRAFVFDVTNNNPTKSSLTAYYLQRYYNPIQTCSACHPLVQGWDGGRIELSRLALSTQVMEREEFFNKIEIFTKIHNWFS